MIQAYLVRAYIFDVLAPGPTVDPADDPTPIPSPDPDPDPDPDPPAAGWDIVETIGDKKELCEEASSEYFDKPRLLREDR